MGEEVADKIVTKPKATRADAKNADAWESWREHVQSRGMYPLSSYGMPMVGPDFLRHAEALGDNTLVEKVKVKEGKKSKTVEKFTTIGQLLKNIHLRALREPGFELPIGIRGGKSKPVTFIPGHIWAQYIKDHDNVEVDNPRPVDGPHPATVMVIGKMPSEVEASAKRYFVGPTGKVLVDMIGSLKIEGSKKWYMTNILKFRPPDGSSTIKANWLRDCLPLLHQELRIVKPRYILCLGADASKVLLGNKYNI